ncbi:MAG: AMP-binding protein [Pseudonocardia sp.]|nr:AMP-binding protein [Pseudonocardia sp.]
MNDFSIALPSTQAEQYHAAGIWRDFGPVGDLRRWRDATPHAVAIRAFRAGAPPRYISYDEYARYVERFAGALYELGVRPGQVVAVQLPNWWQAGALILATARLGAVLAPIMTTVRSRELGRVLERLDATVCISVGHWAGFDHTAALREIAPRLPHLHHRVILGGQATDHEIDFSSFFEDTAWEQHHPVRLDDTEEHPDRVAVVYFTSGTSGEPKGALHTSNTIYAGLAAMTTAERISHRDVAFTPHALMHLMGQINLLIPLLTGGCTVLLDSWSGERGLTLLAETDTTIFMAAPAFYYDLIAAAGGERQDLRALRMPLTGVTTVPRQLVPEAHHVLGVPLRAAWGMTEVGIVTWTRGDDRADWAAQSDGRPSPMVELDLRSTTEITREQPARLFVRGPAVCVATLGRDSPGVTVIAEHNDGWYDTGDLVIPDGEGGIRVVGRVSDRIGGMSMIPVSDVEDQLRGHPRIGDAALVGYPDGRGGELACAVIVSTGFPAMTLHELRAYLLDQGMTDRYIPSKLAHVPSLPRNDNGKVRKELLRRWLQGEAELSGE